MGNTTANIECVPQVLEYHLLCRYILATLLQERGLWSYAMVSDFATNLAFQDKEPVTEADMSIMGVYKTIWSICKLKRTFQSDFGS
jgi:hypothetical protein